MGAIMLLDMYKSNNRTSGTPLPIPALTVYRAVPIVECELRGGRGRFSTFLSPGPSRRRPYVAQVD
jgi:hypothetical protein